MSRNHKHKRMDMKGIAARFASGQEWKRRLADVKRMAAMMADKHIWKRMGTAGDAVGKRAGMIRLSAMRPREWKGKRVSVLGMGVILALTLSACSKHPVDIQPKAPSLRTVVLIAKSKNGDYWNTIKMGAEAAAKEFGVKLVFDGPEGEGDVKGQQALVRQYLAYGMDALILAANDYEALADTVKMADSKGVPVVTVDSEVNATDVRSFIGIDNYKAGRLAAAKMKSLTGGKGRFVILSSYPASRNAEQRKQGIIDEWENATGMSLADTLYCGDDISLCKVRAEEALHAQPLIAGVLTLNASASIGTAQEIKQLGLVGKVKLIAFENTQEELEWMQEDVIQATLISNPFSMGYLSVKTALAAADHEKVDKRIVTETKVIDSDNMFWSDNQKMLFPFVQ